MPEIPKAIAAVTLFIATTSLSLGLAGTGSYIIMPPPPAPPPMSPPSPALPPAPVDEDDAKCADDPSWCAPCRLLPYIEIMPPFLIPYIFFSLSLRRSIDPDGTYTCAWLASHDPGCVYNSCDTVDYGQCRSCPRTCNTCDLAEAIEKPVEYGTLRGFLARRGQQYAELEEDDGPIVRALVPLLLLAGSVGVGTAVLDVCGAARFQPLVAKLALLNAALYLVVAWVGTVTFLTTHPNACMSTFRRVLPLTSDTKKLGPVVSFPVTHPKGAHLLAVLLEARFIDVFKPSCALVEGAVPLVLLLAMTHLEYWRRIWHAQRWQRRSERLLERLLERLVVGRFEEVRVMAVDASVRGGEEADSGGNGGGDGGGNGGGNGDGDGGDDGGGDDGGGGTGHGVDTAGTGVAAPAAASDDDVEGGRGFGSGSSSSGGVAAAWQGEATDCPICMEDYAADDLVAVLPCKHLVHKECLLSWAKACATSTSSRGARIATCPLCKQALDDGAATERQAAPGGCCSCCCTLPRHWRRSRATDPQAGVAMV